MQVQEQTSAGDGRAMSYARFGHLVRMGLRGRRLVGTLLFVAVVALAALAGGVRGGHGQSGGRRSLVGRRIRSRSGRT